MKTVLLLLFILCTINSANSINDNPSIGARSSGMANTSASLSDVWSVQNNQAGLGFLKNISCGTYYENRFLIKELSLKSGVFAIPIKAGTFGVSFMHFGNALYSESKYNLSFAKKFGDKFSMGIGMNYLNTKIGEGYGSKGVAVSEIGILAIPIPNFTIGLHIYNPTRTKLNPDIKEYIPTVLRFGCNYQFSKTLILAVETEKDISQKPIFKGGIEYQPLKGFYLRMGLGSNPNLNSFGFGISFGKLKIDLSANYNQVLGFSPQFDLVYVFKKK